MEHVTKARQIYLSLIEAAGQWNAFDGGRIAADLSAHLELWRSAVLTRLPTLLDGTRATELCHHINLVVLRDLPKGDINLDTLFILSEPGQQDALEELAGAWSADEVAWIPQGKRHARWARASFSFPISQRMKIGSC